MKKMNEQKAWSFAGILVIMLVISIPFYSARVMAVNVQITKNQGEDGLWGFLDANNDVWTVEAVIGDVPEGSVDPANLKIKIGSNEGEFKTCTDGPLGVTCEYISPLSDGIKEAEHTFQVVYEAVDALGYVIEPAPSNGDVIRADGSAPKISGIVIEQNSADGEVDIDFTVKDKIKPDAPAVGIKIIEIIDADTGNVLQTLGEFEQGLNTFNYADDSGFGKKLQATFTGDGLKRIKIRAEDHLGHVKFTPAISFLGDFVEPEIKDNLEFIDFGKFIGEFVGKTDINISIVESNNFEVVAYSDQAALNGNLAGCEIDEEVENLWLCTWKDVEVNPDSTISIKVVAGDEFGNVAEKIITKTLSEDTSPPQIDFFGSERTFETNSYIKSGEQRIILKVREDGAGITEKGIRANLGSLGSGSSVAPDECEETPEGLDCYWKTSRTFTSAGVAPINLETFHDNVDNDGEAPTVDLIVDTSGPKVEEISIYGVSGNSENNYFQSNDLMKIVLTITEISGLVILLDLDGVVNDAQTDYLEDMYSRDLGDGWIAFTEDNCVREEGKWLCEVVTPKIKSGPSTVRLNLKVQDTAGNDATLWPEEVENAEKIISGNDDAQIEFKLLGSSSEPDPDYWKVKGRARSLLSFVDLDAARITNSKAPFKVSFEPNDFSVKMLSADLVDCVPKEVTLSNVGPNDFAVSADSAPTLRRTLMYGGNVPEGESDPVVNIILEFDIFEGYSQLGIPTGKDFEEAFAEYSCQLNIFSSVGTNALQSAEKQEVIIPVSFSFSELGSVDENLKKKIKDLKDSDFAKFADGFSYLDIGFKWANWVFNALQVVVSVTSLIDLFAGQMVQNAKAVKGSPWGPALRGSCLVLEAGQEPTWDWVVTKIQFFAHIFNCNPDPGTGWYGQYQNTVLGFYNGVSGRTVLGIPANSLYENMYTSIVGLCLPGIAYNVNKAREVHCRKIVCYGREVPSGIATMEACDAMYDLQMCEFVWGPIFDFLPLGGIAQIGKMIKSAFSSPLGLITLTEVLACTGICFADVTPDTGVPVNKGLLNICKATTAINKVLSIINSIVSSVQNRPDVSGSPYCKMAESIKLDELVSGGEGEVAPVVVEETATAPEVEETI